MERRLITRLEKTPIWPEYELTEYTEYDSENKIYKKMYEFNCLVRLKGEDNVYYLTRFMDKRMFDVQHEWQCVSHLNEFIRKKTIECCVFSVCGIASGECKDTFGNNMFEVDKSQISEKERLQNLVRF